MKNLIQTSVDPNLPVFQHTKKKPHQSLLWRFLVLLITSYSHSQNITLPCPRILEFHHLKSSSTYNVSVI